MDVEQRAREFHEAYERLAPQFGYETRPETREFDPNSPNGRLMMAVIAALPPPEGHVVVTRNEAGQSVAVTRQDDEGRILSVIAEFAPPEGYVLVPVEPTEEMESAAFAAGGYPTNWDGLRGIWIAAISARPEVPNVND